MYGMTAGWVEEGTKLGRLHGAVVAVGTLGECKDVGLRRASTRAIVLYHGLVFAYMNHSAAANVHVSAAGWVVMCVDVTAWDEIVFDYGALFWIFRAHLRRRALKARARARQRRPIGSGALRGRSAPVLVP